MAKKKEELTAVKRKDGRYMVKRAKGGYLNGDDKVKYLREKGLIKAAPKSKPSEAPAAEAEG